MLWHLDFIVHVSRCHFLDFFASYRSRPPCETISHVDTVANNYGSCFWVALYRYTIFHALSRQELTLAPQ